MIRVLHVYDGKQSELARYVSLLTQAMPADVESRLCDEPKTLRHALDGGWPHIVHVHGCPTLSPLGADTRLVVSPHGWPLVRHHAYVAIARSQTEARRLNYPHRGLDPLPHREIVRNPLITKSVTAGETGHKTAGIYRRVMRSAPLQLMDTTTRHTLRLLLKAGLLGDARWTQTQPPCDTAATDWLHLLIYAHYEGLQLLVAQGASLLGISLPALPPASDIYLPPDYAVPTALATPQPASAVRLVDDIRKHGPTLLRLTELHRALHHDSLDERQLMDELQQQNLRPLFSSLLQLMSEQTLLDPGFMPCPPADNALTGRLRQQIENHLKI